VGVALELFDAGFFGSGEAVVQSVEGIVAEVVGLVDVGCDVLVWSSEERKDWCDEVVVDSLGDADGGTPK